MSSRKSILSGVCYPYKCVLLGTGDAVIDTAGATKYVALTGATAADSTESYQQTKMPCAGILKNFVVTRSAAPGVGKNIVYTVRVNGANSALTCTLSGAAATTGEDVTHEVVVAKNDLVDISIALDAGGTMGYCKWGVEVYLR